MDRRRQNFPIWACLLEARSGIGPTPTRPLRIQTAKPLNPPVAKIFISVPPHPKTAEILSILRRTPTRRAAWLQGQAAPCSFRQPYPRAGVPSSIFLICLFLATPPNKTWPAQCSKFTRPCCVGQGNLLVRFRAIFPISPRPSPRLLIGSPAPPKPIFNSREIPNEPPHHEDH